MCHASNCEQSIELHNSESHTVLPRQNLTHTPAWEESRVQACTLAVDMHIGQPPTAARKKVLGFLCNIQLRESPQRLQLTFRRHKGSRLINIPRPQSDPLASRPTAAVPWLGLQHCRHDQSLHRLGTGGLATISLKAANERLQPPDRQTCTRARRHPSAMVRRLLLSLGNLVALSLLTAARVGLLAQAGSTDSAATHVCADQRPADNGTRNLIVVFRVRTAKLSFDVC